MSVVPPEYTFTKKPKQVNIRRLPVRAASDTQTYANNGKITIVIPPDFVDFRAGSFLSFYAIAPINGGTFIRFSYPIQTIFRRVTVYLGSQVIEDIDDYQALAGMFKLCSSNQAVVGPQMEGSYTDATRATQTNAGRLYSCKLRLESLERVWPLHKLLVPLRIVLQLADVSTYIEYDGGATAGLSFSEVYMNYYVIQPDDAVDQMLDASIKSGNAQVCFHSWDNYNTALATATSQTIMLPYKRKCVNGVVAGVRLQSEIASAAVTGKFTDQWSCSSTIQSGYVKINSQTYPQDFYNMQFNQGYYMLAWPLNSLLNDEFSASTRQADTFSDASPVDRVIVPFDLRKDSSPSGQNAYGNGVDTSASGNAQTLQITYAAASGAISVDVFGKYEVVVTLLPGGGIDIDS
jgi:hypothetical protein